MSERQISTINLGKATIIIQHETAGMLLIEAENVQYSQMDNDIEEIYFDRQVTRKLRLVPPDGELKFRIAEGSFFFPPMKAKGEIKLTKRRKRRNVR